MRWVGPQVSLALQLSLLVAGIEKPSVLRIHLYYTLQQ